MEASQFGSVIIAVLNRSMVEDHFSGFVPGPVSVGAITHSGSVYHIILTGDESIGLNFEDSTYSVRRAETTVNGELLDSDYAGFCRETGTFLVLKLQPDGRFLMERRSSSLSEILLLEK